MHSYSIANKISARSLYFTSKSSKYSQDPMSTQGVGRSPILFCFCPSLPPGHSLSLPLSSTHFPNIFFLSYIAPSFLHFFLSKDNSFKFNMLLACRRRCWSRVPVTESLKLTLEILPLWLNCDSSGVTWKALESFWALEVATSASSSEVSQKFSLMF